MVVVEHDEDTIRAADHIIDIGPSAGKRGGTLVAQGTVQDVPRRSVAGVSHPHTFEEEVPRAGQLAARAIVGDHPDDLPAVCGWKGVPVRLVERLADGRLGDEIKRLKLMDLEFANDVMTATGEDVDRTAVKKVRAEARAEAQERFRKGNR